MTDSMASRPTHPASSPACLSSAQHSTSAERPMNGPSSNMSVNRLAAARAGSAGRARMRFRCHRPLTLLRTELVLSRLRGRHPALTHREQHGVDAHTTDEGNSSFGSRGLAAYALAKRQTAFSSVRLPWATTAGRRTDIARTK